MSVIAPPQEVAERIEALLKDKNLCASPDRIRAGAWEGAYIALWAEYEAMRLKHGVLARAAAEPSMN